MSCENSSDEKSPLRKLSKIENELFSFMTPTKQGKKRHVLGDHVKIEASQHLLEPCEGTNPLYYWKENEDKFPILVKLAKIYLNVPATSAPVERLLELLGRSSDQTMPLHFKC